MVGGNLQFQASGFFARCARHLNPGRFALPPDHQVALDSPLRVQHQVPCAAVCGRSFTVFVTMPLSQRKRSSPRTATRRIQPRSWAAAPPVKAAVSSAGASNSIGVSAPQVLGELSGGLAAVVSKLL